MQVVDLHWNPHDPWTLLSVADEAGEGGGGTLHAWRISDLVYRPADEVRAARLASAAWPAVLTARVHCNRRIRMHCTQARLSYDSDGGPPGLDNSVLQVVAELEPYRDYILTGNEASLSRKPSTSGQLAGGPGAGNAHPPSGQDRSPAADAGSRGDAPTNGAHGGATL